MLGLSAAALVIASALVPRTLAHGGVISYSIAGTWYDGWKAYNSPVDPTVNTLGCNDDGTSPAGQLTATVAAGSPITAFGTPGHTIPAQWQVSSFASRRDVNDYIFELLQLTYLAQCPGSTCTGLLDQIRDRRSAFDACSPFSVFIFPPNDIHTRFVAAILPGMCTNHDHGWGSRAPTAAELVSFSGAYKASDPGGKCPFTHTNTSLMFHTLVTIDLYDQAATSQMTYVIPGPPLYGAASAPPSNPNPVPQPSQRPPPLRMRPRQQPPLRLLHSLDNVEALRILLNAWSSAMNGWIEQHELPFIALARKVEEPASE
ncbi:glycoside hydrolase family protein [Salix suchowensis]|nr:glycoside hydrolase family protein [Salix suchowensis]